MKRIAKEQGETLFAMNAQVLYSERGTLATLFRVYIGTELI